VLTPIAFLAENTYITKCVKVSVILSDITGNEMIILTVLPLHPRGPSHKTDLIPYRPIRLVMGQPVK
jgi:hypothetical protein